VRHFTALRPARLAMTLTLVAETNRGSQRIVIPTSISNSGTQPATIHNAKLIESSPERQSLWVPNLRHPSLRHHQRHQERRLRRVAVISESRLLATDAPCHPEQRRGAADDTTFEASE
jgi:hypothetical protein